MDLLGGAVGRWHGPGFVYVMKNETVVAYKIGCSRDPEKRLREIRRSSLVDHVIELLEYFYSDEMNYAETAAQEAVQDELGLIKDPNRGGATDWFKNSRRRPVSVILETVGQAVEEFNRTL